MLDLRNRVICDDCVRLLRQVEEPFADLVFADPPFNIGYKYDKYDDEKASDKYLTWTRDWIGACAEVLKPCGSFYIAIGDEYAANVKLIADGYGLVMRNWIIWHYTFGQQLRRKFARSHTHILYFVKDAKAFTFNDGMVRVISDRQKKYSDKRANPAGKMPDDVWNEYPRVCGTFRERTGFPCQMPESLLTRIIRASSNEGDWVLDPFCGSGTTAVAARKLNRTFTTIDISDEYVEAARTRVADAEGLPVEGDGLPDWPEHADNELKWLYSESKIPLGHLCKNRMLLTLFTKKLNGRLQKKVPYTAKQVHDRLSALGSVLSPIDKVSAMRMEAPLLEE